MNFLRLSMLYLAFYSSMISQAYPMTEQAVKMSIIFDCDGVLVDTEHLKFLAWQEAFKQYEIAFEQKEYLPLVGYSSKHIFDSLIQQKNVTLPENFIDQKDTIYQKLQHTGVPKFTGAIRFVQELAVKKRALGIVLGLASSAGREEIMANLKQIGLDTVFDVVVSGHDDLAEYPDPTGTNKPKPYIYKKTAQLLGVWPSRCIVFEDTNAGIVAAVSAGMIAIAVPNAYTRTHDFSLATQILDSFDAISVDNVVSIFKIDKKLPNLEALTTQ